MNETLGEKAKAVAAIGRIESVPTLLAVLCETAGLSFAAVVRVTEQLWTVCAMQGGLQWDVKAGDPLVLEFNLPFESQSGRAAILVEQGSNDPACRLLIASKAHRLESYISVPISIANDRHCGTLCAIQLVLKLRGDQGSKSRKH